MNIDILEKLFGSSARVKILRLFLFNREKIYSLKEVARRAKTEQGTARKEVALLLNLGFVKEKPTYEETRSGRKRRVRGYTVETTFRYYRPLYDLLIDAMVMEKQEIVKRLSKAGKIKMIILSGVFIKNEDSRLDMLIAGDDIKERKVKNIIQVMEAELGTELRFAVFSTADFKYRMGIWDRLVRDVLDYDHEIILDKLSLISKS